MSDTNEKTCCGIVVTEDDFDCLIDKVEMLSLECDYRFFHEEALANQVRELGGEPISYDQIRSPFDHLLIPNEEPDRSDEIDFFVKEELQNANN